MHHRQRRTAERVHLGARCEELDKRLTAALIEERPAIFLDNYNGKDLASDILASTLIENPCEERPMRRTAMVKLHSRTLVAIIGNNVRSPRTGRAASRRVPRSGRKDRVADDSTSLP